MSIANKCKVSGCEGLGKLQSRNNKRYFILGFCVKHYKRHKKGVDMNSSIRDHRPAIIKGEVAMIPLGVNAKDGYAIVDKEFSYLDKYKWTLSKMGYPTNSKRILMHRLVFTKNPTGLVTDHINRNKLDNRLSNLRHITQQENSLNSSYKSNGSIKFTGVMKAKKRWSAAIIYKGKRYWSGTFATKEEAAIEYNKLALKYHGKYAKINKV